MVVFVLKKKNVMYAYVRMWAYLLVLKYDISYSFKIYKNVCSEGTCNVGRKREEKKICLLKTTKKGRVQSGF
jgi:hypothetical protein